jgi:dTDP-4-amino-4,6-dideoxygalactose transaminase
MTAVPITRPLFDDTDRTAILKPLETGWVVQGPFVARFEDAFAAYSGVSHAVAASSCTTALHMAVAALGLRPGDEVIVPAFTWISTANVVEYMGATPVFCDITLDTFNLDVKQLDSLVTPRTVGIIPVHLFGLCADMGPILDLASRRGLWVVEDAACGFGARIRGRHAGSFGAIGCFSFHPRKSITTGEGGMAATEREDLAHLLRSLRDHGASHTDYARHGRRDGFLLPEFNLLGFNYRMTDLQGALGCAQMRRAEQVVAGRAKRAAQYGERLRDLEGLALPSAPDGFTHGYQAYVCLYRPDPPTLSNVAKLHGERNALMTRLAAKGIATRQGTHAVILQKYYASKYRLDPDAYPNAYLADRLSLALPLFPQMTDAELELVCRSLEESWHAPVLG